LPTFFEECRHECRMPNAEWQAQRLLYGGLAKVRELRP
jgi:hypothetical protein